MGTEVLVGTWQIHGVIHAFSPDLARIPVTELKKDGDAPTFADMRFVFSSDGKYRVYSTPDSDEIKREGNFWQDEDGDLFIDPIVAEGIHPAALDNMKKLKIENGEMIINIPFMALFLRKII